MSETKQGFEIDPILNYIGISGKWQIFRNLCLMLFGIGAGMVGVAYAFPGYIPKHRCAIPICENGTNYQSLYETITKNTELLSCQRLEPISVYDTCEEYLNALQNNSTMKTLRVCDIKDLVFDRSIVESSIVEDFEMVCENAYQRDLFNSILFIGAIIGSLSLGFISDNYGRLKSIALSLFLMGGPGVISSLWMSKSFFAFHRILAGIGWRGSVTNAMVVASETAPVKHKVFFMFLVGIERKKA